jgi:hypothetical protein
MCTTVEKIRREKKRKVQKWAEREEDCAVRQGEGQSPIKTDSRRCWGNSVFVEQETKTGMVGR